VQGRVCHHRQEPGTHPVPARGPLGMGIQFLRLPEGVDVQIDALVRSRAPGALG
jgi:hypothetical protein